MKIALFGSTYNEDMEAYYIELLGHLNYYNSELLVYKPFYDVLLKNHLINKNTDVFSTHDELKDRVDFMFSIGGDGTLLKTITLIKDSGIPVLGFNTGRLGFLSGTGREEIKDAIEALSENKYKTDTRSLLEIVNSGNINISDNYALNEISVHKRDSSSMISIHAYVNDIFLNTYWADGLIIATPTGSTAYSLSCGGPILTPDSNNFIINPIAIHNLTVRPVVIPDDSVIKLKIEGRDSNYLLSIDSRSEVLQSTMEIIIKKASFGIKLVKLNNNNFFTTIREKLMWGLDKRN